MTEWNVCFPCNRYNGIRVTFKTKEKLEKVKRRKINDPVFESSLTMLNENPKYV